MSFQPSRTENIKTLFHGNKFQIPSYQRKYSWGFEQRKSLWDDIAENINLKHFIGTLCFKKVEDDDPFLDKYEIIDGQQRITTLYILLNVLIEKIEDKKLKEKFENLYIGVITTPKLSALGVDEDFLNAVIFSFESINYEGLIVRSQINLYKAKKDFIDLSIKLSQDTIKQWITFITTRIEILIFNVLEQAEAVKMFSVINDRGLPLSNLDKTKSLLMLYSTLYLNEELNFKVNFLFGKLFDHFDEIIYLKNKLLIFKTLDDFDFENTFYTHHYYSAKRLFPDWDYQLGADSIFKQLKRLLENRKTNKEDLKQKIEEYAEDFYAFSQAYVELFRKIESEPNYQQFFLMMEFTATLYPLIVCLFRQNKLEKLFEILESVEMRVYKLKGTNPRRNMYYLASDIQEYNYDVDQIYNSLSSFSDNFCNDYYTEEFLLDSIDNKTSLIRYLLYKKNLVDEGQKLSLEEFRNLQVEHIFSISPNFSIKKHGFGKYETYNLEISKLGNLAILERSINKEVNNIAPIDKISGYQKSKIKATNSLIGVLDKFNKDYIGERTGDLINFFMKEFNKN